MIFLVIALAAFLTYVEARSLMDHSASLRYEQSFSKNLVAPDETFEIITGLTNLGAGFFAFLRLAEELPAAITVQATSAKIERRGSSDKVHVYTTYLLPHSRLERRLKVSLPTRGRYVFLGAEIGFGDFLGLNEHKVKENRFGEVVVYPAEAAISYVLDCLGGFIGDLSVRRFIIEDPVLTVGFRDYTGREPLKAISWLQSAKAGRMMVKNYDYTTEPVALVLLNIETVVPEGEREALIEGCYSIAHSVCRLLEERGIPYSLVTNAMTAGAFLPWTDSGEGLGQRHFLAILEGLGRASYRYSEKFGALWDRAVLRDDSAGIVLITPDERDVEAIDQAPGRRERQMVVVAAQSLIGSKEAAP